MIMDEECVGNKSDDVGYGGGKERKGCLISVPINSDRSGGGWTV